MNPRRQSLKRQHAFVDAVTSAIREAGGVQIEHFEKNVALGFVVGASFHLETRAGLARISAAPSSFCGDKPGQPGGGQLFVRFEDVPRACAANLPHAALLNRFSGKWNHDLWNLEPEAAYARTVEILRSIAVQCPTCLAPVVAGHSGYCESCWTEKAINA